LKSGIQKKEKQYRISNKLHQKSNNNKQKDKPKNACQEYKQAFKNLENTCPTADPEKEMEKKRVGCAMLNLREMLSNSNKGKKVQVSV